ncbi:MAG TPA: hypothetical protein VFB66_16160 [Tepidisphaeraceae bacterium]|nr:hypothetical protein [Tepidisphaeraceae bacterium]
MPSSPPPRVAFVVLITFALAGCTASRPELLLETPAPSPAARQRVIEAPVQRGARYGNATWRHGAAAPAAASPAGVPLYLAAMPEVPWKSNRSYPSTSEALHPQNETPAAGRGGSAHPGVWSLGYQSDEQPPLLPFDPHAAQEADDETHSQPYQPAPGGGYFADGADEGFAFTEGMGYTYVFESTTLIERDLTVSGKWHRPSQEEESSLKTLIQKLRLQLLQFELNGVPAVCDASVNGKKVVFKVKMKM